jgi:hypothetical protein
VNAPSDPYWSNFFSFAASNAWGTVKSAGTEIGLRVADFANDLVFNASFWTKYVANGFSANGVNGSQFYNGSKSQEGQLLDNGQTNLLRATASGVPFVGNGYNVITGQDLLTGRTLDGADRAAAGFGLVSELAFASAGVAKATGYDPFAPGEFAAPRRVSLNVLQCFVAGTQVLVGIVDAEGEADSAGSALGVGGTAVSASASTVRFITQSIECVKRHELVVARDESDPGARLALRQVDEVYERMAYGLTIVTLRSSTGMVQTLHTTSEHPVYVPGRGWVVCRELKEGDELTEPFGAITTVISARHETHREGVLVYNFRVADSHTYFVRELGSTAEPVWVHNSDCAGGNTLKLAAEAAAEEGSLTEVTPRQAGVVAPPDHHIFPQAFRSWFAARGINVDEFTVTLDKATHGAIHFGGGPGQGGGWWNDTLMSNLYAKEVALSRQLTSAEILEEGRLMLQRAKLDNLPVHPYNSTK